MAAKDFKVSHAKSWEGKNSHHSTININININITTVPSPVQPPLAMAATPVPIPNSANADNVCTAIADVVNPGGVPKLNQALGGGAGTRAFLLL